MWFPATVIQIGLRNFDALFFHGAEFTLNDKFTATWIRALHYKQYTLHYLGLLFSIICADYGDVRSLGELSTGGRQAL
jgi:hypothetical protein